MRGPAVRGRWGRIGTLAVVVLTTVGCDSLLEVELPGRVRDQDLDNPVLASALALAAESEFDCALGMYAQFMGLWANDLYVASNILFDRLVQRRLPAQDQQDGSCEDSYPHAIMLPMHMARAQAERAIERLNEFDDADVPDKTLLLAKSHAYAGYSYQLLGEAFCGLTFDGGPLVTREATMRTAIGFFTSGLDLANLLSSSEARSLRNMVLVGRARAHLNLGEGPEVVADASQVDAGFARTAQFSDSDSRRYNPIYMVLPPESRTYAVHPSYANLLVGGVADPRVPLVDEGLGTGFDAVTHMWGQAKFPDRAGDIQFASWREAQLMIAEVEGGQTAVGIINTLRARVADLPWVDAGHPSLPLPQFVSTDDAEISAQVWEERRRELLFQGTKLGDMLRVSIPGVVTDDFETGINQRGDPYNDAATCIPIMDQETLNNSNL